MNSDGRTVSAVIQARMGSTRLPGKVLRDLGGRPVLDWVIRAARESGIFADIVVATTGLHEDDALAAVATTLGAKVVRGSVDDVLSRFILAADAAPSDAIVRLTADCPLLDPTLISTVAAAWQASNADYVSTITPRCLPRGLDIELVSTPTLRTVASIARGVDRTHVTSHVYTHPADFDILGVSVQPAADDLRVTLDTAEDAQMLDGLVALLGDSAPRWQDTVATLRAHPELVSINAEVRQKALAEG